MFVYLHVYVYVYIDYIDYIDYLDNIDVHTHMWSKLYMDAPSRHGRLT